MTAAEFLADYAERSRTTPEALTEAGRVVVACFCRWEYCKGWVVIPRDVVWARDTVAEL